MLLLLLACATPEPEPVEPVIVVAAPAVVEEWRCSTVRSAVIERHVASVRMTDDGRFRLDHTNVDPHAGTSTVMEGTWTREPDALVLTPDSGLNRRWKGDGHRYFHGESTHYCGWEEPLAGGERRLAVDRDAEGRERVFVRELRTHLVLGGAGVPCDDVRPNPSTVSGGQTYDCVTPPR